MDRRKFLAIMGAAAVSGCGAPEVVELPPTGRRIVPASELADRSAVRFRHLDLVNAVRGDRGLAPVAFSQALNSAAITHARDMALQQRAWHFGSDRSNPQTRASRAGYRGLIVGENIAEAFEGDLDTFQNWLDTPEAFALIVNRQAREIGFGWFRETNGKLWWVQLLGAPSGGTGSV